jgi:hypothetical protein
MILDFKSKTIVAAVYPLSPFALVKITRPVTGLEILAKYLILKSDV